MPNEKKQLDAFYHDKTGYWYRSGNRYRNLNSGIVRNLLQQAGYSPEGYGTKGSGGLNDLDCEFTRLTIQNCVDYAGPLAGHRTGLYTTSDGRKILVTSEPGAYVFTEPKKRGDWDSLQKFLGTLLGDQILHFMYWVKFALDALREFTFRPGQMSCFCGPSDCGKSLVQMLVTELLGGRCAKAWGYMSGDTDFNSDLCEAEHLIIEDEASSTDIRTRKFFGAMIKQFTVAQNVRVHGKGLKGITLHTYRRMSLSCNSEAEDVMVIPPMVESLMDKVNLYLCGIGEVPFPNDRQKTWATFLRELPFFAAECHGLTVPAGQRDRRYGVKAFHHSTLLMNLSELAPETVLLQLIDQTPGLYKDGDWKGSAQELENTLRAAFAVQVDRLIKFPTACGVYLARLASTHKDRFFQSKAKGFTRWTIKPPPPEVEP